MATPFAYIPISDNTYFYKILDLNPQENDQHKIKRHYNKLLKYNHPDKGGSEELMQNIVRANEILTNYGIKYLYDKYGEIIFDFINPDKYYPFITYYNWASDLLVLVKDSIKNNMTYLEETQKFIYNLEKKIKDLKDMITEKIKYFNRISKAKIKLKDNLKEDDENIEILKNNYSELEKMYLQKIKLVEELREKEKYLFNQEKQYINLLQKIQIFVDEKVNYKFKEIYQDQFDTLKEVELNEELQTNQLDYADSIIKNPALLKLNKNNEQQFKEIFRIDKMHINGIIQIFKSQVLTITIEPEVQLDNRSKYFSQNYEMNIERTITLPYDLKIFDSRFFFLRSNLKYDFISGHLMSVNSINLGNFLYNQNMSLKLETDFGINIWKKRYAFNNHKVAFSYKINSNLSANFNANIVHSNLESHISQKIDKSNKITLYINVGKSKMIIGLQKIFQYVRDLPDPNSNKNDSNKSLTDFKGAYSCQNSIYLHEKGIILSNQNSINFKIFGFDFDSSINIYKKRNISFNTVFTFGIRIHKLNFKLPIKVSRTKNVLVFGIVFLSNLFGPFMNKLYNFYRRYQKENSNYYKAVKSIIREKYDLFLFSEENLEKFRRIVVRENEINGLVINYAFIGNLEDLEKLNNTTKQSGTSNPEIFNYDNFRKNNLYDIKMALTLRIVENKIIVKNDIYHMEGIYNPALHKYENIGIIICYNYRFDTYYEFIKNIQSFKIPLVD